jgi:hypothetical protein
VLQENAMKTFLQTVGLIAVLFVLAVVVDQFTPLKQLDVALREHPEPYRSITIGLSIVAWALLIGAFIVGIVSMGQPMSEKRAKAYIGRRRNGVSTFRGKATGREFRMEASFKEIKDAIRTGAWLRDHSLWPLLIGLVGLTLAAYGMFGFFFVIGAPLVKLICAGALAYATARTVWGFARA